MSEWSQTALPEVLDFREGPGILAKDFVDEGVPLIRLAGLKRGASLLAGCNRLRPEDVSQRWSQFQLEEGDVLLSTSASLGEVATVGPEGVGAVPYTGIIRFRPKDGRIDPAFIPHLLTTHTFASQIAAMGVGSVMKHFGPTHLKFMDVAFPAVQDQRAIAEVLGALDDKIAANTRQAITARELMVAKTASAQEHCELRHLATRTTSTVKPEELGDTIVDHFSLPAFDAAEGPERVQAGVIKSNKTAIDRPCVLLSKLNPRIPRAWDVVTVSERPSMASTEFLVLEPKGFSSSVLWAVISQPRFWSELSGMVAGTSGSHQRVRPGDVLAVNVIDPRTISEPVRRSISALGEHVAHVHVENVSLATTRDALLPLLMSGMVTVRDAESVVEGVV